MLTRCCLPAPGLLHGSLLVYKGLLTVWFVGLDREVVMHTPLLSDFSSFAENKLMELALGLVGHLYLGSPLVIPLKKQRHTTILENNWN